MLRVSEVCEYVVWRLGMYRLPNIWLTIRRGWGEEENAFNRVSLMNLPASASTHLCFTDEEKLLTRVLSAW